MLKELIQVWRPYKDNIKTDNCFEFYLAVGSNFYVPKYIKVRMIGEEKAINKSLKTLFAKFDKKRINPKNG